MIWYSSNLKKMPHAKTCQEVEEMEMPPLQELSLRFTGSHLANASGLGQMLGAEPMSQSLRSVQLWFSNLPCAAQPVTRRISPLKIFRFEMLKAASAMDWMDVERFFEVLGGAGLMGASHEAETGRIGVAAERLQGRHWRSQAILASQIAVGDDEMRKRIELRWVPRESPRHPADGNLMF